jgi:hypothetical protein
MSHRYGPQGTFGQPLIVHGDNAYLGEPLQVHADRFEPDVRAAMQQGWSLSWLGSCHLAWRSPTGALVVGSAPTGALVVGTV